MSSEEVDHHNYQMRMIHIDVEVDNVRGRPGIENPDH